MNVFKSCIFPFTAALIVFSLRNICANVILYSARKIV